MISRLLYPIFLLLLLFTTGLAMPAGAQSAQPRLHMFVIGQVNGGNIGAVSDYPRMQEEARSIAGLAGLELVPYFYEKEDINARFLVEKIRSVRCGEDDVVWFYYTGHGYNASNGAGNFPSFRIGDTSFSLEWIHNAFEQKGARLVISMFDCCNFEATRFDDYDEPIMLSAAESRNYVALFGTCAGSVKIASNMAGFKKYSYGSPEVGGLFSVAFREAFQEVTQGSFNSCSWERVAERTRELTTRFARNLMDKEQVPYYEIEVIRYR